MKKILSCCLVAVLGMNLCWATVQTEPTKKKSTTLQTQLFATDITCDHCKQKIMNAIPFEKGVKDVVVDVPTKRVTVVYDASKNNVEELVKSFSKIRVNATAVCDEDETCPQKSCESKTGCCGGACCKKATSKK
jgi:copper chaperone CopZ